MGNALPLKDYSELVNGHDIVIRFNRLNFLWTGFLGRKTDIWAIQNMDETLRRRKTLFGEWERLLIISENKYKDYTQEILQVNNWEEKLYSTIYSDDLPLKEKLRGNNGSSGFIILEWVLQAYPNLLYPISIVGFTWEGWTGHSWELERELCYQYQFEKKVKIHL
ncbi:hypothetical protein QT327_03685 [Olivibacter sp. 47]|uniref:hypothetical protein n=1 Tax=Olivibacter sp. 47 TaxID=3056486 RepID=UPI0025A322D7|nr:hypothetical protein [Olivibacter sp. 47]MDM8173467.1 hypothetical protein [Olivibacter sp. 47]